MKVKGRSGFRSVKIKVKMLSDVQNRNKAFQERGMEMMKQERLLYKMLEIDDQLKELYQIELESKIVKECGIIEKTREMGILVSSQQDYLDIEPVITQIWQMELQRDPQHQCGKNGSFYCQICGIWSGKKTMEIFLQERKILDELEPTKHHQCSITDLKFIGGCRFFSLRRGLCVKLPSNPVETVISREIWFICMETGKMHNCGNDMCSAIRFERMNGVTVSYACDISGYKKKAPLSHWNSWDGQRFYSVERLQTIRNDLNNREIGDFDFNDGEMEEDMQDMGYEDVCDEITEKPNPGAKKRNDPNSVVETAKEEIEDNAPKVNVKKRKESSESHEEHDEIQEIVEDDEEEHEEGEETPSNTVQLDPRLKLNQLPKRQKINDFMNCKKYINIENPLQHLKNSMGDGITTQTLAYRLAQDELEEEETIRELRKEIEEKTASQQMRFSISTGNREMRRRVLMLNAQIRAHHNTIKSREEGPKKRASKREERLWTSEEKSAQFLARGDIDIATTIVRRLTDAGVKNGIAKYRLMNALDVVDLSVMKTEINRDFALTVMAYRSLVCSRISKIVRCKLVNEYVDLDCDKYVAIIMEHWNEASKTPLVTKVLDKHKKKKHKPLDFVHYCIGMLYTMANGGAFVRVKMTDSIPPVLLTFHPKFSKFINDGPIVNEIPDAKHELAPIILNPEFIRHLSNVYSEDKHFTNEIYQESLQAVKQCYESRHRQEQEIFFQEIREAENNQTLTFPIAQKMYKAYLVRLKPPHLRDKSPCHTSTLPHTKSK